MSLSTSHVENLNKDIKVFEFHIVKIISLPGLMIISISLKGSVSLFALLSTNVKHYYQIHIEKKHYHFSSASFISNTKIKI